MVRLEDLPNIGKAIARDLRRVGIREPSELPGRDPYELYQALERVTGQRQDPCLLDVFISVVRFMEGGPPHPWWFFTSERKQNLLKQKGSPLPKAARD